KESPFVPTLAAPLDFAQNEARNMRAHQLATAPATPVLGQQYYNTTNNVLSWWNGTVWVSAEGGPTVWPQLGPADSSTAPNYSFAASPGAGMYSPAAGQVGLTGPNGVVLTGPVTASGSLTAAGPMTLTTGPITVPGQTTPLAANPPAGNY